MDVHKFAHKYDVDESKVQKYFETINLNDEKKMNDIELLMHVVMKIKFLKTKYPEVLKKDYENGNLAIMARTSNEHKYILALLESGASIESVIGLMIESQINTIHEMYADRMEYELSSAYLNEVEMFGGEVPKRRSDAYMYNLFDELVNNLL